MPSEQNNPEDSLGDDVTRVGELSAATARDVPLPDASLGDQSTFGNLLLISMPDGSAANFRCARYCQSTAELFFCRRVGVWKPYVIRSISLLP